MMPKASSGKEAYWRKMLGRQRKSGLSARAFCRKHQLSEPSLYYWKRQIGRRDRSTVATPQPGPAAQAKSLSGIHNNSSPFVALKLLAGTGPAIELIHPRGHVVRIPTGFDPDCLQQVLQLLDR